MTGSPSIGHLRPPTQAGPGCSQLRSRLPWVLAALAVACQISYPLLAGSARDRITVATVLVTAAAMAAHGVWAFGGRRTTLALAAVVGITAAAEVIGVHTGIPFGHYRYGDGLGPAVAELPLVVPLAWTMTAYPAVLIGRRLVANLTADRDMTIRQEQVWRAIVGGWALASWDVFLDPQMVAAGHWTWSDPTPALPGSPGIPLTNYAGWIVVATVVVATLDRLLPPTTGHPAAATGSAAHTGGSGGVDLLPGLVYLWTYAAQCLANLAFFDRPAVALLGGLAMGLVALPYARALRAATR